MKFKCGGEEFSAVDKVEKGWPFERSGMEMGGGDVGPCEGGGGRLKEGEAERRKAWWWRWWWWWRSATQALSLADLHVSVLNYPVPTAPVTLFSLRNSSWTPNTI